ncbi:hypothetical protein DACRYDRAFT_17455 [Dacryopinax primogenitus]|uniref:Uncharacterized protein n=1 Tax=Dacryopinax primogenitus (strain DJM 731) TaxID=1858805 RepID=M5FUT2_DACPD|nr:uncharacterized protein DACRYDRAFT_17455 [Dacryopinax primogenitus]EJT99264.1 hypothetical protein DACRYDRAFT_17455 [Dacryopinax primogenitus]
MATHGKSLHHLQLRVTQVHLAYKFDAKWRGRSAWLVHLRLSAAPLIATPPKAKLTITSEEAPSETPSVWGSGVKPETVPKDFWQYVNSSLNAVKKQHDHNKGKISQYFIEILHKDEDKYQANKEIIGHLHFSKTECPDWQRATEGIGGQWVIKPVVEGINEGEEGEE